MRRGFWMKVRFRLKSIASRKVDVFDDVSRPCRALAKQDRPLRRCLKEIGSPVIRRRIGGFEGLFRIIIEQQVSVPSAQAIWRRCCDGMPQHRAEDVLSAGIETLQRFGLSGPKAGYVHGIATRVASGEFTFDDLVFMSDEDALTALVGLKGIGPWSAAIYLLFCEGRADIWPAKDVALKHAYNAVTEEEITQAALDDHARAWTPYRGIAAHILWTYYAHMRGRVPI